MNTGKTERMEQRRATDAVFHLTWTDAQGNSKTTGAPGIDICGSGVRVEMREAIEPGVQAHLSNSKYQLNGSATVRHCESRGMYYLIGLEFSPETRDALKLPENEFIDYYEVLQIGHRADPETILRVYRIMATRYHPDNPQTGNHERFLLLKEAYETLSDPLRRAQYDCAHQTRKVEALPVFELREFVDGVEGESNRRLGLLALLYNQRRSNPDSPGMSLLDLEKLMSFPREYLSFTVWYLKEKHLIRVEGNSDFVLTADGLDHVETGIAANKVLTRLLKAPSNAHTVLYEDAPVAA